MTSAMPAQRSYQLSHKLTQLRAVQPAGPKLFCLPSSAFLKEVWEGMKGERTRKEGARGENGTKKQKENNKINPVSFM